MGNDECHLYRPSSMTSLPAPLPIKLGLIYLLLATTAQHQNEFTSNCKLAEQLTQIEKHRLHSSDSAAAPNIADGETTALL